MNTIIKVNGRDLKCSFGLGFLGECLESLDLSVTEIGQKLDKNPFKWLPVLMYESIKYANGGKLDFTQKQLVDWLDEDGAKGSEAMNTFLLAFLDSMTKNVPKQEDKGSKEPKKK